MHHISKIIRSLLSIHLEILLRNLLVLSIGSHDKIPSVFCAYCKRQGHVISDYPVLKARKESKPEVAYSSSESSFKQDFMPSRVSHCPQTGNLLNQLPPSKDFTCSSMTSRDYVPLGGHLTTVHLDLMPVHQDLTNVYQDSIPLHQDFTPINQDLKPVYQDSTLFYQDFLPASQDLSIVKDVCAT